MAPEKIVVDRDLLRCLGVTRVELNGAFQISFGFVQASLPALDLTHQLVHPRVIGQTLPSKFKLSQSTIVIEVSLVKIFCTREMSFACIRTEARSCSHGR